MTNTEIDVKRMLELVDAMGRNPENEELRDLLRAEIKLIPRRAAWDNMCGWAGVDETEEKLGKRPLAG